MLTFAWIVVSIVTSIAPGLGSQAERAYGNSERDGRTAVVQQSGMTSICYPNSPGSGCIIKNGWGNWIP